MGSATRLLWWLRGLRWKWSPWALRQAIELQRQAAEREQQARLDILDLVRDLAGDDQVRGEAWQLVAQQRRQLQRLRTEMAIGRHDGEEHNG